MSEVLPLDLRATEILDRHAQAGRIAPFEWLKFAARAASLDEAGLDALDAELAQRAPVIQSEAIGFGEEDYRDAYERMSVPDSPDSVKTIAHDHFDYMRQAALDHRVFKPRRVYRPRPPAPVEATIDEDARILSLPEAQQLASQCVLAELKGYAVMETAGTERAYAIASADSVQFQLDDSARLRHDPNLAGAVTLLNAGRGGTPTRGVLTREIVAAFASLWIAVVRDLHHIGAAGEARDSRISAAHAAVLRAHVERARKLITIAVRLAGDTHDFSTTPAAEKLNDADDELDLVLRWIERHAQRSGETKRPDPEIAASRAWVTVLKRDFGVAQGARGILGRAAAATGAFDAKDRDGKRFATKLKKAGI